MANPQDFHRVQVRAYEIWEREGRPQGREADNWKEAERELEVEFRIGFPDAAVDTGLDAEVGGADNDPTRTVYKPDTLSLTRSRQSPH